MKAVTLMQAKTQLGALLNAAERGERVLIRRNGKRPVALVPLVNGDDAVWPEVPVAALEEFEAELAAERSGGKLTLLGLHPAAAAAALRK